MMSGGGGGGGRLLEEGDYFKYFGQRRVIIQGRRLIEERLLFEEIGYLWDHNWGCGSASVIVPVMPQVAMNKLAPDFLFVNGKWRDYNFLGQFFVILPWHRFFQGWYMVKAGNRR